MKTVTEWSLEFDRLYNNIFSSKAPGLNEYEKSVFLTRAEQAVCVAAYKGALGEPFESSEEITAYLGTLVKQADCTKANATEEAAAYKISSNSVLYKNPADMLFRTWEGCNITVSGCGEKHVSVIPITQDEYWRAEKNPFRGPNARKVLRLSYIKDDTTGNSYSNTAYSELISKYPITAYTVRYLKKPEPIILEALTGGLSIDGSTAVATCKLPEALHQTILAEAVKMAKVTWNM